MSDINNFCQGRLQLSKEPPSRVLSTAGIGFIERMLVPEPAKRMTVSQGLNDSWILDSSLPTPVQHGFVPNTSQEEFGTRTSKTPLALGSRTYAF